MKLYLNFDFCITIGIILSIVSGGHWTKEAKMTHITSSLDLK